MGRKIPFENVVRNLELGRYRRIVSLDYSNEGGYLFDRIKFADNLGVSWKFLEKIGLLKTEKQSGWNLIKQPTVQELLDCKELILKEANQ